MLQVLFAMYAYMDHLRLPVLFLGFIHAPFDRFDGITHRVCEHTFWYGFRVIDCFASELRPAIFIPDAG